MGKKRRGGGPGKAKKAAAAKANPAKQKKPTTTVNTVDVAERPVEIHLDPMAMAGSPHRQHQKPRFPPAASETDSGYSTGSDEFGAADGAVCTPARHKVQHADDGGHEQSHGENTEEDYSDTAVERQKEYRKGGYHPVSVGELYNDRYRVVHKLGWGYFSTVWLVWDYNSERFSAMKVQKSAKHYREAAFDEIKLLSQIMNGGHAQMAKCCAAMTDSFEHVGPNGVHVCMIFDVLGENLLTLIERYEYKGVPIPLVKSIAHQCLLGLAHIHSIDIIHTDLKPENVLLSHPKHKICNIMKHYVPPPRHKRTPLLEKDLSQMTKSQRRRYHQKKRNLKKRSDGNAKHGDEENEAARSGSEDGAAADAPPSQAAADAMRAAEEDGSETDPEWEVERFHNVCLADFGNSCWTHKQFTDEVQTRQYRAPEVILGDGYSTPIDLWSLACMVFELITGEFLFDPKNNEEYSRDEDHLALMAELLGDLPEHMTRGDGKFTSHYYTPDGHFRHIEELRYWSLEDVLHQKYHFTQKKAHELAAFMVPMLALDPQNRATAVEMLEAFEEWFAILEDDYSPLCYSVEEDAASDLNEEEEVPSSVEGPEDPFALLHPDVLAERGLTIDDVKRVVSGEVLASEDLTLEARKIIDILMDEDALLGEPKGKLKQRTAPRGGKTSEDGSESSREADLDVSGSIPGEEQEREEESD